MKKALFLAAMCGMTIAASAQSEMVQNKNIDVQDTEEMASEMTMDNSWTAIDIQAAEELEEPIVSIKRPGGVFFCGYLQTRNSQLTTPYAKAPAYTPLTWGISKEDWNGKVTANGEYVVAVPTAYTIIDEEEDWLSTEGEDITSMLLPMASSFYSVPFASCAVGGNEMLSQLLPQYTSSSNGTTYDPHLYAGGSLPKSSTYGYAMAANYAAAWAGSNTSHSGYGTFNTVSENWNKKLSSEDAKPIGICETFAKPASPYMLTALNAHFNLPEGATAGTMKLRVRKCELNESGSLKSLGEVVATSSKDEFTATNSNTWIIYNFDELKDAEGNEIDKLIVDYPIVVEIYCADETTNIRPMYKAHEAYYDGDNHAYTMVSYTDAEGNAKTSYQSTNFKWTNSSTGLVTYQSSFMVGLEIKYPFAKVVDQETGVPTKENVMEMTVEGGSKAFFFDAYYNYGAWELYSAEKDVVVEYDSDAKVWNSNVDWLNVTTESGKTEEGGFNGEVTLTLELAANTGAEREFDLLVDCYGFIETIHIKQEGSVDAINTISTDNTFGKTFNLAGQQVSGNYKGVVVRNGVKTIRK